MSESDQYQLTLPYYFGQDICSGAVALGRRDGDSPFLILFTAREQAELHLQGSGMQVTNVDTLDQLVRLLQNTRHGIDNVNPSVHHVCFKVEDGRIRKSTIAGILAAIELQRGES
jgi:hypothetical protein